LSAVVLVNVSQYYEYIGEPERAEELEKRAIELEPAYPSSYARLAELYVRQRRFDEALELADEYAAQFPDSFYAAYMIRGHVLRYAGRYEEAIEQMEEAIALAPERASPYANLAWCLWDIQRWSEARNYLEIALEKSPNRAYLHQNYGRLIGNEFAEYRKSIEHLNRAIELNPRDLNAYNDLASMHDILGNPDSAQWAIDKAIELAPNTDARANYMQMKGTVYEHFGAFDSAISTYRQILELRPDDWGSIQSIAVLFTVNRQYSRADSVYEVLESEPDSIQQGWARFYRIAPLCHQGRFQESLVLLQKGIETDRIEIGPSWPLLQKVYQRGRIYQDYLGMPEKAIEEYKAAQQVNLEFVSSPFWTTVLLGFQAQALAETGRIDDANNLLRECYGKIDPSDVSSLTAYYGRLAAVLRIEHRYDSAIVLAENEAKTANTSNQFRVFKALGIHYLLGGRIDDAVKTLEKAMSRYDSNRLTFPARSVITHYYLGQAYEAAGRTNDAIEQYEIFLDIWKNADEGLESVEDARARLHRLTI
jgi:tetratricopeptide (TPR) repeat protein